jgi:hypothetical protein
VFKNLIGKARLQVAFYPPFEFTLYLECVIIVKMVIHVSQGVKNTFLADFRAQSVISLAARRAIITKPSNFPEFLGGSPYYGK